jgi:ATP-dependent helicase/nuclease subunit B
MRAVICATAFLIVLMILKAGSSLCRACDDSYNQGVNSTPHIYSAELLALPTQHTLVLSPSDRARRGYQQAWSVARLPASGAGVATLPRFATTKNWFAQLWQEGRLFGLIDDTSAPLSPAIERALWCHIAQQAAQTSAAESAALGERLMEAWMLEHGYGSAGGSAAPIASGSSGELYREARTHFVAMLKARNAFTSAELPQRISRNAQAIATLVPRYVIQTPSFAPLPSEQRAVAALLTSSDARSVMLNSESQHGAIASRAVFVDASEEREAAIAWAETAIAARDQQPGTQLPFAIVVPDLKLSRGTWQRRLSAASVPFNLSLGLPVSAHPWAAAGFTLVNALAQPLPVEMISQALRHPRWGHWDEFRNAIDRPMQKAINNGNARWQLGDYLSSMPHLTWANTEKVQILSREVRATASRKSRSHWGDFFERAIAVFTSSERTTTSEVFQLRDSLFESIETWLTLDEWLPDVTMLEAQQELMAITDQAAFQPEGSHAPLQVIGLLESAGVPFHGVWLTSMTERVLPEANRSNPFLSAVWQRDARAGLASIDECSDRAARLVEGWCRASSEVVASIASRIEGEPQVWSPLCSDWPLRDESPIKLGVDSPVTQSPRLASFDDETAPAWQPSRSVSARAIEAQALCPRRGFSAGRLKLEGWAESFDGVSPLVRGNLIHAVAESLGRLRMDQNADEEMLQNALPDFVSTAVNAARDTNDHIAQHVWQIETERLIRVWNQLLKKEAARPPFKVAQVEESLQTEVAGLAFSLRVDRVDEFDSVNEKTGEVRSDRRVVIDFKSGNADRRGWSDDRLTAPQLPLYAHAVGIESVDAAAYARVSDDHQDFHGFGTSNSGFSPKRNPASALTWEALRDTWPEKLATLATELLEGEAALAPAYGEATCNHCDFARFCRVDFQALTSADDEPDESET